MYSTEKEIIKQFTEEVEERFSNGESFVWSYLFTLGSDYKCDTGLIEDLLNEMFEFANAGVFNVIQKGRCINVSIESDGFEKPNLLVRREEIYKRIDEMF